MNTEVRETAIWELDIFERDNFLTDRYRWELTPPGADEAIHAGFAETRPQAELDAMEFTTKELGLKPEQIADYSRRIRASRRGRR